MSMTDNANTGNSGPLSKPPLAKKHLVYIAGPVTAATPWLMELNARRAELVSADLASLCIAHFCPHTQWRYMHGILPHEGWMAMCLTVLERCDAVVLVEGWETSRGSHLEIDRAYTLNIPVYQSVTECLAALAEAA